MTILKLSTPAGLAEGHDACAAALKANVADHLLSPAPLDPRAPDVLLAEVQRSFTKEDNAKLQLPPDIDEVKKILSL